ncbi:hypothetical protein LguiA_020757 [Lonicera macranthoides]
MNEYKGWVITYKFQNGRSSSSSVAARNGNGAVSLQGKQLMYRLLHRDTKNRLGSCEGANEIEKHPFFRGLNWALSALSVLVRPDTTPNKITMLHNERDVLVISSEDDSPS